MDAARRRRFEIMVLVSAYKIMPDKDRMPLRAELLKWIEEDFQATIALQKGRIAQAEKDLIMLRAELADREARSEELIERELERLINLPPPGRSRRGMPIRNSNTPGPQSQEMDRNLQDKMN